ncbi:MAG: hypothetical protein B5M53_09420 [Candidatus Cloacimonas sp. 4484_209]|nr:MAG: hypothetical protein B5M53_09420 [Candidatus Cloacimonas sp. 4484_209]
MKGFIVDSTCGKLAKWLRLMGVDIIYVNDQSTSKIELLALKTGRTIITRSGKLKKEEGIKTILLRTEHLIEQIDELDKTIGLKDKIKPFKRCPKCNTILTEVKKEEIKDRVPPFVFKTQKRFSQCPKCGKVYWQGTHYKNIKKRIKTILLSLTVLLSIIPGCMRRMFYKTTRSGVPLVRVLVQNDIDSFFITSKDIIYGSSKQKDFSIGKLDTFYITSNSVLHFPVSFESKGNSPIILNGISYPGRIVVYRDSLFDVVNIVDMETYLKGVVPQEIGFRPYGELEAVKAQAVAARTYAIKHLNLEEKPHYDLKATVADQVYRPEQKTDSVSIKAVDDTYGEVITYKGKPIEAKYSSTCGGFTSDVTDNWGKTPVAYLKTVRDAPPFTKVEENAFCRASPLFQWEKRYTKEEFYRMLKRNIMEINAVSTDSSIGNIKMFITEINPRSKRVITFKVITDKNQFLFKGLSIRKVLRENDKLLYSNFFNIKQQNDSIIINGRGAGHGCGMCQWGAIGMARIGYSYIEILKHYYRKTKIEKVY